MHLAKLDGTEFASPPGKCQDMAQRRGGNQKIDTSCKQERKSTNNANLVLVLMFKALIKRYLMAKKLISSIQNPITGRINFVVIPV